MYYIHCICRFRPSCPSELEASRAARDSQANIQTQLEKHLEAALLANKRLEELDKGMNRPCIFSCLELVLSLL